MTDFSIRRATHEDLAALERLMYLLHDEHHQAEPIHFKTAKEVLDAKNIKHYIEAPDAFVFVAETNKEIVGFISGHFGLFESSISKPVMMGSVDELYVELGSRKHGVGSELLTRSADEFDDYGVKQIMVEVWDFNQAALKLYTSIGYQAHIHCLRKDLT